MIFINTSFELKNKTGIGAYILTLIKALEINNKKYKSIELTLPPKTKFTYFFQLFWLNTVVFFQTLIQKPEIFISPSFIMPYFKVPGTKYITVIYDLCFLRENETSKYHKFIFNLSTKIAIKKADIIVTDSEIVKNELIGKYNLNPNKIAVLYCSLPEQFVNSGFNDKTLIKYGIEENKYILSVATMHKRKNIPELIKAFENISDKYPDLKLVLVGGMGNENREKLTKHPNVIFTGYIPDEDIPTLYKNALIYMYPSVYEGFGIPLIEAQYSNCPVLCSDIPVFRETAENSAEFCEPIAANIAEKLEFLINNPARREELKILGSENAKRFDMEHFAEQLKQII